MRSVVARGGNMKGRKSISVGTGSDTKLSATGWRNQPDPSSISQTLEKQVKKSLLLGRNSIFKLFSVCFFSHIDVTKKYHSNGAYINHGASQKYFTSSCRFFQRLNSLTKIK